MLGIEQGASGPSKSKALRASPGHVAAFLLGAAVATATIAGAGPQRRFGKLDVFARVLTYVENNYVERVDAQALVYGAAKGLVKTLDPHSAFMTPREFADLKDDTDGQFGGVGVEIDDRGDALRVVEPLPDTPASRAGLKVGDLITHVDGQPASGDDGAARLRGRPGTTVSLTIERAGWQEPRTFALTREVIRVKAVELDVIAPGVAWIRLKQFQERTDAELTAALEAAKGKDRLNGVILDLRDNPGGLLDQAVRVADLFLTKGTIVTTVGRGGKKLEEHAAREAGTYAGFPMIVLLDGGSASASEIVAGALQDHKRALVVGTRSFGKGSVQNIYELDDGSGLKLTTARYLTPSGRSIQERGIDPDLVAERVDPASARGAEDRREVDLAGHLANPGKVGDKRGGLSDQGQRMVRGDSQLAMAWQALLAWDRLAGGAPR